MQFLPVWCSRLLMMGAYPVLPVWGSRLLMMGAYPVLPVWGSRLLMMGAYPVLPVWCSRLLMMGPYHFCRRSQQRMPQSLKRRAHLGDREGWANDGTMPMARESNGKNSGSTHFRYEWDCRLKMKVVEVDEVTEKM
ncbi:hypothetical protein F5148DRAFT_307820 [Russula earlei]|uniref:Uncharacterized protein n=1 Tax=Russula earlei TaxID=71964 RepID=A0ACC0U3C0_9AGAM|nr:hypothetical protein F5148DRAFT_307820 [Russula earlei]